MSLIITPQSEIDAYYASENVSQSDLKKLLKGINKFGEGDNIDNKSNVIIGKAVDMILTGETDEFKTSYYVSTVDKLPSDTVVGIINRVYDMLNEDYQQYLTKHIQVNESIIVHEEENLIVNNDDIFQKPLTPAEAIMPFPMFAKELLNNEDYIIAACEEVNYQARWGRDAKLKAIIEPGAEYFRDLCNAYGKKVIDSATHNTIQSIVMSLRTNPRTSKYFDRKLQENLENVTFIYQMPIYFEYRGIQCKALLDLVVVVRDEQGRIISVSPIDLKTMFGNTYDFLNNLKQFRYDIQAAWYSEGLISHYALERNVDVLTPFKFIVESNTNPGKPLVYMMSESLLKIGKSGRQPLKFIDTNFVGKGEKEEFIVHKAVKGFDDLIDMYLFHEENGWDLEAEIIDADNNETPLVLDWNGFVITETE